MQIDIKEIERIGGRGKNHDIDRALRILELNQLILPPWQLVETAPKDGTEFVAAYGHQGFVKELVRWDDLHKCWSSKGNPVLGFETNVTHWHPMPANPK